MTAEFRHTLEAFLNPLFLVLLLIVMALFFSWKIVWARRFLLTATVMSIIFSTSWLPAYLTKSLESVYPAISHYDASVKYIVVLSGGQADVNDKPAEMVLYSASVKRLLTGIRLWKQIPEAKLVLSGGGYGHQTAEAIAMRHLAKQCGVPNEHMIIEDQSLNTSAQSKALKSTLGNQPFYLVTSATHMPRSMMLFRDQGMKPIAVPTDYTYYWQDERWQKRYIPNAHNLVYTEIAMHELLGIVWHYLLRFPR